MDIRCCNNCFYTYINRIDEPCFGCNDNSKWEAQKWLNLWLSSFNNDSATECFTAVNQLREKIGGQDENSNS